MDTKCYTVTTFKHNTFFDVEMDDEFVFKNKTRKKWLHSTKLLKVITFSKKKKKKQQKNSHHATLFPEKECSCFWDYVTLIWFHRTCFLDTHVKIHTHSIILCFAFFFSFHKDFYFLFSSSSSWYILIIFFSSLKLLSLVYTSLYVSYIHRM